MNKKIHYITVFAFIIIFSVSGIALGEDETTVTNNNVQITVKKIADEIKGFKTFEVTCVNNNSTKKTLNGNIFLNNSTRKEPTGAYGECTVYMELPGESTQTKKLHCKEKADSDTWSFKVKKVYDF